MPLKQDKSNYLILFAIILAFANAGIETDLFIPSFPDIMHALSFNQNDTQTLLSLNFLGILISGLISGPMADTYGRATVLKWSCFLFSIASFVCYEASSKELLMFGRFCQGLGAGSIMVSAAAVVYNLLHNQKAGQFIAFLSGLRFLMIAIAPILGSYLNIRWGYQSGFLLVLVLAMICFAIFSLFLRDEKTQHPLTFISLWQNYLHIIRCPEFFLSSITLISLFATIIIYSASSSILFINTLGVSEANYGIYQTIILFAYGLSNITASYFIGKIGLQASKNIGIGLFLSGVLILVGTTYWAPTNINAIVFSMTFLCIGAGLAGAALFASLLFQQQERIGTALSLNQNICVALLAFYIEITRYLFDGHLASITWMIAGLTMIIVLCMFLTKSLALHKH